MRGGCYNSTRPRDRDRLVGRVLFHAGKLRHVRVTQELTRVLWPGRSPINWKIYGRAELLASRARSLMQKFGRRDTVPKGRLIAAYYATDIRSLYARRPFFRQPCSQIYRLEISTVPLAYSPGAIVRRPGTSTRAHMERLEVGTSSKCASRCSNLSRSIGVKFIARESVGCVLMFLYNCHRVVTT